MQDRFDAKYEPDTNGGCWLWTDALNTKGYGCFSINRVTKSAHRVSWALHNGGPPPEGLHVLHKCDVRSCVNPDHLWLGTNYQNTMDRHKKGRTAKGKQNEDSCRAVLTNNEVASIRDEYASGESMRSLGRKYGVSKTHIGRIVRFEGRVLS